MTGSRENTSGVIVTGQNHKIGTRPRIGMSSETVATITYATVICCTIPKIPQVIVEAWSSSIENSRTARSDSRIRHKVHPRHRLNNHIMAGYTTSPTRVRNSQDNSKGPTGREDMSHSTPSRC